jgi:hypothetical protein
VADLFDTLWQLLLLIVKLIGELGSLALHWWVVLLWFAWWLWAVNWQKAWPVLARGAWAPFVLLIVLAALAWSQIAPSSGTFLGMLTLPNFWWQLGAVTFLACTALLCGWLQGLLGWTPTDVAIDPPVVVEHGHGHAHH